MADNHGWAQYKRGCRCGVCKAAAIETQRKARAKAAQRKIEASLAAIAEQKRLEEAREEHDRDLWEAHCEEQRKFLYPTAEEEAQRYQEYEAWCVLHGADRTAFD